MQYKSWTDKYRPNIIDDLIQNDNVIKMLNYIYTFKIFLNMIFYGPPGTGKTSAIKILLNIKQSTVNTNNIDKIEEYIKYGSKLIIVEDVDSISIEKQLKIKKIVDDYPQINFILTCINIDNITPSLSYKFICIKFSYLTLDQVRQVCKKISESEKILIDDNIINQIYAETNGDMRKILIHLQNKIINNNDLSMIDVVFEKKVDNQQLWNISTQLYNSCVPIEMIIKYIQNKIKSEKLLNILKYNNIDGLVYIAYILINCNDFC